MPVSYMSPQAAGEGPMVEATSSVWAWCCMSCSSAYTTALELFEAEDLPGARRSHSRTGRICHKVWRRIPRKWLNARLSQSNCRSVREARPTAFTPNRTPSVVDSGPASDSQPIKIVPKGLRSFDEYDADFFLELLPGPRDRDGLPESIRFWKDPNRRNRMPTRHFPVGLIYGPSGCGKSSLVKAGCCHVCPTMLSPSMSRPRLKIRRAEMLTQTA